MSGTPSSYFPLHGPHPGIAMLSTRSKYFNLVGDEDTARSLGDLGRIETWHKVARERLEEWRRTFVVPAGPELPTVPQLQTDLPIADYLPSNAAPAALVEYDTTVSKAADELVATLQKESTTRYPQVEALRGDIQASLGGEQHATPELAGEAEQFKTRLSTLEQKASDLAKLDKKIADDLVPFPDRFVRI